VPDEAYANNKKNNLGFLYKEKKKKRSSKVNTVTILGVI